MTMNDDEIRNLLGTTDGTVRSLAEEILRLRGAIRQHRDKRGHELCWLNDLELWSELGENSRYPHDTLPVREEFLRQCAIYYESRIHGTPYEDPRPERTVID